MTPSDSEHSSEIASADLAVFHRVVQQASQLPVDDPRAIEVRRAVSGLYKAVKIRRRAERRDAILAHDAAVTAQTATGAPGRIDDETQGIPLISSAGGAIAGVLQQPRGCYVCKQRYTQVDAFYHQLCPECAAYNHARRDARTDLTGRRALLTGGRAKIGMYIALRLLRDGAHTTITTRFPKDAVRRFSAMPDAVDWIDRLHVVGIDLRDPAQVIALAESVSGRGYLDILINNACQTVRRTPAAYAPLVAGEGEALEMKGDLTIPTIETFGRPRDLDRGQTQLRSADDSPHWLPTPDAVSSLALMARSATVERIEAGQAIDAGGLVPDLVATNSWVQTVDEVDPIELLEVQLCNQTAPYLLVSKLRGAMAASPHPTRYIVNVSAMEGQFARGYKGPGHPHTNMAKAALNMLTRTSAHELYARDRILMTAVDTGWITDERPHTTKLRLADDGFHAPLDLVDGAARVYDPIVRGEAGEDLYGVFLKDYAPAPW